MTGVVVIVWIIGALIAGHICTNATGLDDFNQLFSDATREGKAGMIAILAAMMLVWPLTIPFALLISAWYRKDSDA